MDLAVLPHAERSEDVADRGGADHHQDQNPLHCGLPSIVRRRGGSSHQRHAGGNQHDPDPARGRNVFTQEQPRRKSGHHVTDRGDRHHVAQIRPAEKRHVGQGPDDQQRHAERDPGMEQRGDERERRIADIAQLLHAAGQE